MVTNQQANLSNQLLLRRLPQALRVLTKATAIVDYLNSIKVNSSFTNRKKLAAKYGIKNYSGSEKQNISLLNKLRSNTSSKSTQKPKTSSNKYPLPTGVLRRGSAGNGVKQLQRALNAAHFKVGKVDGIYGSRTRTRLDKVVN